MQISGNISEGNGECFLHLLEVGPTPIDIGLGLSREQAAAVRPEQLTAVTTRALRHLSVKKQFTVRLCKKSGDSIATYVGLCDQTGAIKLIQVEPDPLARARPK